MLGWPRDQYCECLKNVWVIHIVSVRKQHLLAAEAFFVLFRVCVYVLAKEVSWRQLQCNIFCCHSDHKSKWQPEYASYTIEGEQLYMSLAPVWLWHQDCCGCGILPQISSRISWLSSGSCAVSCCFHSNHHLFYTHGIRVVDGMRCGVGISDGCMIC